MDLGFWVAKGSSMEPVPRCGGGLDAGLTIRVQRTAPGSSRSWTRRSPGMRIAAGSRSSSESSPCSSIRLTECQRVYAVVDAVPLLEALLDGAWHRTRDKRARSGAARSSVP